MQLSFTRISPTHHRFEYRRDDGTGEAKDLETKSFLTHDFIHYVLETEAKLSEGFYGALEKGETLADLSDPARMESQNSLDTERVAGACTSLVQEKSSAADIIAGLQNIYKAHKQTLPAWVTVEMLERAVHRYRRLIGEWNSLPFGRTLELTFNTRVA